MAAHAAWMLDEGEMRVQVLMILAGVVEVMSMDRTAREGNREIRDG